jgi:protein disulfide isomerase family A protein 3
MLKNFVGLGGLLVIALCFTAVNSKESDVLVLTDKDFESKLAALENTLVMFYAPWCGHCKKLKPEFDKAADLVKDDDPPIALAKVDCTEDGKETCNKFSVSGYPTLKIFRNGELSSDYNGPREANGIVKHMRSQVGPASKEFKTASEFKTFLEKDDVGVVAFLAADSKLEKTFTKVSDKLREKARFGRTNVPEVLKEAKQKEDTLVLYRPKHLANKFEPDFVVYDGAFDKDDIEKFITTEYHGLVGVRTQDSAKDFKPPVVIAYFGVDYKKNPKGTNYWRNRILKVAQDYKKDFTFAVSSKDEFQYEMNEYGIDYTPSDKPIVTAKNAEGKKFIMPQEFSVENFADFLGKLKRGEVEPFLKSEPIPAHREGPVTVAVGLNFEDVVIKNDKDTLVEFYAPWCGHCKKLTPIYDELATKLKDEEVAIVKMDATANDVPSGFDVRGFPTLYWLPKNSKDTPVRYEGGRELEDFVKYIAKHATDELKGYDREGKERKVEL